LIFLILSNQKWRLARNLLNTLAMTRSLLRIPESTPFLHSSSAKKVAGRHKIHSTPCQSCVEIMPFDVHDENMPPFALRESVSNGPVERRRVAARAREKIGDGFFHTTARAGIDHTRRNPGRVISNPSARRISR
jgi:hypothetical protein